MPAYNHYTLLQNDILFQILRKSKIDTRDPKDANRVWKGLYTCNFGCTLQLSQNSFFGCEHSFYEKSRWRRKQINSEEKIISEILPANLMPVEPLNPGLLTEGAVHKWHHPLWSEGDGTYQIITLSWHMIGYGAEGGGVLYHKYFWGGIQIYKCTEPYVPSSFHNLVIPQTISALSITKISTWWRGDRWLDKKGIKMMLFM